MHIGENLYRCDYCETVFKLIDNNSGQWRHNGKYLWKASFELYIKTFSQCGDLKCTGFKVITFAMLWHINCWILLHCLYFDIDISLTLPCAHAAGSFRKWQKVSVSPWFRSPCKKHLLILVRSHINVESVGKYTLNIFSYKCKEYVIHNYVSYFISYFIVTLL